MSKAAAAEHQPKWNQGEAWATPSAVAARANARWKGSDPAREDAYNVFAANERAQKWATFTKVLARAKSDLFEIEQAAAWLDSVGRPLPPEDLADLSRAARVAQRLLGSV